MTLISFLVTDSTIDKNKLMKICLVHDLAESMVGDITPHDGVSKEDKRKLEEVTLLAIYLLRLNTSCRLIYLVKNALRGIVDDLSCKEIGDEILQLWLEYEETRTYEAQLAHQLDKLEMIIQANEYEKANPEKHLDSFFSSTQDSFHHPEIQAWAEAVRTERAQRIASLVV
jgi:putative hydrolase of HD superfamily